MAGLCLFFVVVVATWSPSAFGGPRDIAKRTLEGTVLIAAYDAGMKPLAFGSGFISATGIVITNHHVIAGAKHLTVRLVGREDVVAVDAVIWDEPSIDLAAMRVTLTAAALVARDAPVAVGDVLFAAGNPEGLMGTFSNGIVSGIRFSGRLIQLTAPISPGSSGGPIVDAGGEVVGVAVAQYREGQNLNFAIPVSQIPRQYLTFRRTRASKSIPPDHRTSLSVDAGNEIMLADAPFVPVQAYGFRWRKDRDDCLVYRYRNFDLSLRNTSADIVQSASILVVFFDEGRRAIHSELVKYPQWQLESEFLQPNMPKFSIGHDAARAPCEVVSETSYVEMRVLKVELRP